MSYNPAEIEAAFAKNTAAFVAAEHERLREFDAKVAAPIAAGMIELAAQSARDGKTSYFQDFDDSKTATRVALILRDKGFTSADVIEPSNAGYAVYIGAPQKR